MIGIILSAGKGERLLPYTKNNPKLLINVDDITIFDNLYISLLNHLGVDKLYIGTGYKAEEIEYYLIKNKIMNVELIHNPFYKISGPLVTLWLILNQVNDIDDFILVNGDTLFSKMLCQIVKEKINNFNQGIFLVCSRSNTPSLDDVKVQYDVIENIVTVGKNIDKSDVISAGMLIVKGMNNHLVFKNILNNLSKKDEFINYKKTWHSFLNDLIIYGIKIKIIFVNQYEWYEIDKIEDIDNLYSLINNKIILKEYFC